MFEGARMEVAHTKRMRGGPRLERISKYLDLLVLVVLTNSFACRPSRLVPSVAPLGLANKAMRVETYITLGDALPVKVRIQCGRFGLLRGGFILDWSPITCVRSRWSQTWACKGKGGLRLGLMRAGQRLQPLSSSAMQPQNHS